MFLTCVLAFSFSILQFVKHVTLRCIFLKPYLADITLFLKNLKNLYAANNIKFKLLRSLTIQLHFVFLMESSTILHPTRTIHHSLNMLTKLSSLCLCSCCSIYLECLYLSLSKSSLLFKACSAVMFSL